MFFCCQQSPQLHHHWFVLQCLSQVGRLDMVTENQANAGEGELEDQVVGLRKEQQLAQRCLIEFPA